MKFRFGVLFVLLSFAVSFANAEARRGYIELEATTSPLDVKVKIAHPEAAKALAANPQVKEADDFDVASDKRLSVLTAALKIIFGADASVSGVRSLEDLRFQALDKMFGLKNMSYKADVYTLAKGSWVSGPGSDSTPLTLQCTIHFFAHGRLAIGPCLHDHIKLRFETGVSSGQPDQLGPEYLMFSQGRLFSHIK